MEVKLGIIGECGLLEFHKDKLPNKRSELGKIPNHLVFHGWYGI
jgi:hypothetical protein